ncbi:MAG: EAL domain-containing protein [Gammaproteobacteria bacterium]|nr:EAL domain-containing protein [Gammaproteobacteria bacterium]
MPISTHMNPRRPFKYERDIHDAKNAFVQQSHVDARWRAAAIERKLNELHEQMAAIAKMDVSRLSTSKVEEGWSAREFLNAVVDDVIIEELESDAFFFTYMDPNAGQSVRVVYARVAEEVGRMHPEQVGSLQATLFRHIQEVQRRLPEGSDVRDYEGTTSLISSSDDNWMMYSTPVYGADSAVIGFVTAILDLNTIRRELFPIGQVVIYPDGNHLLTPPDPGPWQKFMPAVRRKVPDKGLIYSEVIPLHLSDSRGTWLLWAGQPNSLFWERADVHTAGVFREYSMTVALLLCVSILIFLRVVRRQRGLLEQRQEELVAALADVRESETRSIALLDAIPDSMMQIAKDGRIIEFKPLPGSGELMTLKLGEGATVTDILSPEEAERCLKCVETALTTRQVQVHEFSLSQDCYEVRVIALGDDRVLAIFRDIRERKASEQKIHELAYYDKLTGLANRHQFLECLNDSLVQAHEHDFTLALLFIDLDQFKRVNDTLGHDAGDLLLKEVASRLKTCIRKDDKLFRPGSWDIESRVTIARLGGDEFTILLRDIPDRNIARLVAERVINALQAPVMIDSCEAYVTPSIGISVFPDDGDDAPTIIKAADMAMYLAKDSGRNNYKFFDADIGSNLSRRLLIENELRQAIANGELRLLYQPQIDIETGRIIAVEALLRWHHPELGNVSPEIFIPIAEESRLIMDIDHWVIREACRQNAEWQSEGLRCIPVAVNISSRQLHSDSIKNIIRDALDSFGLESKYLEIEVTEGTLIEDIDHAITILSGLRDDGVSISLDDFGTGYSSLSYLRRLPLNRLKIDRSFVDEACENADDAAIVRSILAMAVSLNLDVVAEGVETKEQLEFLRAEGCHIMQGFLFSRPLLGRDLALLITERNDSSVTGSLKSAG